MPNTQICGSLSSLMSYQHRNYYKLLRPLVVNQFPLYSLVKSAISLVYLSLFRRKWRIERLSLLPLGLHSGTGCQLYCSKEVGIRSRKRYIQNPPLVYLDCCRCRNFVHCAAALHHSTLYIMGLELGLGTDSSQLGQYFRSSGCQLSNDEVCNHEIILFENQTQPLLA
ncbi:hypothetical protein SSGZ1_1949 [Streptococcus suis GZ1]|uniref:Uncharacterized protein n=1 Tax=Streptococcus suis (strain GZ1) TaxID=423211 RepID=D5AF12_STRGZ|nr:hypothetical protein SSGZ1_1949 [Streptococcus suis GZ1]